MPDELRLLAAFLLSLTLSAALTPLAIRLAHRTKFFDLPVGYKGHLRPTPYLGGAAVSAALFVSAIALGGGLSDYAAIALCVLLLCLVGTADDHVSLGPVPRVAVEAAAAALLWDSGLGWAVFSSEAANLALTVVWIVGIVNAFNLMDNMDGAAGTVGAVSAAGAAALAVSHGDVLLGALCLSVTGACAGFLPYNLGSPARIFLGDGGSMPIGLAVGAAIMAAPVDGDAGWLTVLALAPLVGLPILDTALVVVSRLRRRVAVLSGGRDHLTHRLRLRLPSARAVALTLGCVQGVLCALALGLAELGRGSIAAAAAVCLAAGAAVVWLLEMPTWSPAPQEWQESSV